MTTIDRLGILGIRSYGTDEETFIKFFKPLTIILGRNGSGKSTVIEAVKMATTGDYPPVADKGAAFIHDPRIDNESETKAKIRLMFTNIRNDQYTVSRHFQLSIKPGPKGIGYKTEFKSLDQVLKRTDSKGNTTKMAQRCADINNLLPDLMRVTKAVLNNVIFVHQEESWWPLGDSKKLKEKFDEIFSATRYTKALETIRKYRREQGAELKTVAVELALYEDKVRSLEKVRAEVDEIQVQYESLRKGEEQLTSEIKEKQTHLEAAQQLASRYQAKCDELRQLKTEGVHIERDKKEKYAAMQVHLREETDEDIQNQMDELKRSLDRADGERTKRAKLIEELSSDIEMKREEFNRRQTRRGKLEEQARQQEERLERLEEMKAKFTDDNSMFGKALTDAGKELVRPTSSSSLDAWTNAFVTMLKDAELHVRKVAEDGNVALDAANESVSSVRLRLESARGDQKRKSKDLDDKRAELAEIRRELRNVDSSQASIVEAENKLSAVENHWKEKSSNNLCTKYESEIKDSRRDMTLLRDELESTRRTREQLVQDQSEQARLEFSRESTRNKKSQLQSLFEEIGDLLVSSTELLIARDPDSTDLPTLKRELHQNSGKSSMAVDDRSKQLMDGSSRILAKRDTLMRAAEEGVAETKSTLSSLSAQYSELQREVSKWNRELQKNDANLSGVKRDLSETEAELSEASGTESSEAVGTDLKINELIELFENVKISSSDVSRTLKQEHVDVVVDCVASADKAKVKANQKISQLETGVFIAEGDLQAFEDDPRHRCPACGLSSSKRVNDMRQNLSERVQFFRNPQNLQMAEKRRRAVESAVTVVHRLQSECETALSTLKMFTSVSDRLQSVKTAKSDAQKDCDVALKALNELQSSLGQNSIIGQIVSRRLELIQCMKDFERSERESLQLQESVSVGTGETRSLAEVDLQVRHLEEKIQSLQDAKDRNERSLERERDDLRRAENRVHLARQNCLELKAMSEKYKRLQKEKEELARNIDTIQVEIGEVQAKLITLKSELEDVEMAFQAVRTENQVQANSASHVYSNRKIEVQAWKDCAREVESYNRSGKQRDLENIVRSLEGIEEDIKSKSVDVKGHEKDQQTASDSQKDMEARIRNLRDNQRYRLQEQAANINARSVRNVQAEVDDLLKESGENPHEKVKKLGGELNNLESKFHATKGQKYVLKGNYEKKRKELTVCENEGSRQKFDECRIKKQTMELASKDLEKYHRALDQALVAFHTLKMSSINRSIKELWQQTYRGTDIDEIEITSDSADSRNDVTGLARRNFTYRVLMRRGQASLDMRGRCSAGQKVLACLVIRLALAESFCTECGILALDEPTTNLDRANIESLAAALRAIIEMRRNQRNFQLILITHDEEFIELLGARDFASEYFKIYKNEQQKSCAKIESLLEVGA